MRNQKWLFLDLVDKEFLYLCNFIYLYLFWLGAHIENVFHPFEFGLPIFKKPHVHIPISKLASLHSFMKNCIFGEKNSLF
jgi:hypothetical protein